MNRQIVVLLLIGVLTFGLFVSSANAENAKSEHVLRCLPGGTTWNVYDGGKSVIRPPGQNTAIESEFVILEMRNARIGLNWTHVYNTDGRKSWSAGGVLDTLTGLKFVPRYRVVRSRIAEYPYVLAEDTKGELGTFLYVTLNSPEYGHGLVVLSATSQEISSNDLLSVIRGLDLECLALKKN